MKRLILNALFAALLAAPVIAQLPVSGRAVSQLSWADTNMQDFMEANDVRAGLLAIMHDGVIVYQRGFGYHDEDEEINLPENALVRVASCTKPFTGAAVQQLAADGVFDLQDFAFDLGQVGGGLLPHDPFPTLGDSRLRDVRVTHLLTHRGGWNRGTAGDLTYEECQIAGDMDVNSPPGRDNTLRWILGQPLQYRPGDLGCMNGDGDPATCYSNIGYLAAGLIVEEVTGISLISYLRQNVLTPDMWVPSTDLRQGRTFAENQPIREAYYDGGLQWCVFEGQCSLLRCSELVDGPYGGWDHEARVGQGGLVVSAATMLQLANRYRVSSGSPEIGAPLTEPVNGSHGGALDGVNCRIWQRSDGTNVFIWFNRKNDDEDGSNLAALFATRIDDELDAQTSWPTLAIDGFWIDQGPPLSSLFGGYNSPFSNVDVAVTQLTDGSRVNLTPGIHYFDGIVSTKLFLRAPLGAARIGG